MAKPSAKGGKHAHVDRYSAESASHKAELARDQERWAKERIDIVDSPAKKKRRNERQEQSVNAD